MAVASDALLGDAQDLEAVRDGAAMCRRLLAAIAEAPSLPGLRAADVPPEARIADRELERAQLALSRLEQGTAASASALRTAADRYGAVERATGALAQQLSATLGYAAGYLLPAVVWFILPTASAALAGLFLGSHWAPGGPEAVRRAAAAWWTGNRAVLSDPATVALLRSTVSSVDDAAAGVLRIPHGVQHLLGDEGLGIVGVSTAAAGVAVIGSRFGIFAETPVRVRAVGTSGAAAPHGVAERIGRIPEPKLNGTGAQIVIERYPVEGAADRFEVYLGGTVDFSPVASGEVWDLTSNVHAIAELPAGSYRAAQRALAEAGVTARSDVMFTGYSQGGLIASALAASGDYSPRGLLTVGAPAGQVDVPAHIPVVAIEHSDDLVPALGGQRTNGEAVVVERRAYPPGLIPSERSVPAHELGMYRQTAGLVDHARSDLLAQTVRRFDDATTTTTPATVTGTATQYRAERD